MKPALNLNRIRRAIFAACRANDIDEETRHSIVHHITGHESLAECTAGQLGAVLEHLNRGQGRAACKRRFEGRARVTPAPSRAAQRAKVDALLAELHRVTGEVHTMAYADAIAQKNGWGENVDFCDGRGLANLIAALTRTLQFKRKNA